MKKNNYIKVIILAMLIATINYFFTEGYDTVQSVVVNFGITFTLLIVFDWITYWVSKPNKIDRKEDH